MEHKELDNYLHNDQEKFKELINTLSETELIAYLNYLPLNREFVLSSINKENITENVIKNEVNKNPVCFHRFKGIAMSDEFVNYVFEKLKKSASMMNSPYKESYKKSIDLCKSLLEKK
ncbi:MAG: hypothetical protein U9Q33_13515 [Campylobacterota bacterium]|nr:hypothetical protein [Campylobacterota bacterium]